MASSAAVTADVTALVEATAQTRAGLAESVTAGVLAAVRDFDGWYDTAAITTFAREAAALTGSGQRQSASLTSSYIARVLRMLTGRTPAGARRVPVENLRGVPLDSVYGRLADEYRWLHASRTASARTAAPATAAEGGVHPTGSLLTDDDIDRMIAQRAATMVDQSLTLAVVSQWAHASESIPDVVTGYRRVIHPEIPTIASLRDGKAPPPVCGLCVAASTRVYHRGDLMPVHAYCRCLPMPIRGDVGGSGDIGSVINEDDVGRLYEDAGGSTSAAALKRTRYRVDEHGELGPQLVPVKARKTPYADRQRTAAQRAAARESAARSAAALREGRTAGPT